MGRGFVYGNGRIHRRLLLLLQARPWPGGARWLPGGWEKGGWAVSRQIRGRAGQTEPASQQLRGLAWGCAELLSLHRPLHPHPHHPRLPTRPRHLLLAPQRPRPSFSSHPHDRPCRWIVTTHKMQTQGEATASYDSKAPLQHHKKKKLPTGLALLRCLLFFFSFLIRQLLLILRFLILFLSLLLPPSIPSPFFEPPSSALDLGLSAPSSPLPSPDFSRSFFLAFAAASLNPPPPTSSARPSPPRGLSTMLSRAGALKALSRPSDAPRRPRAAPRS